MGIFDIFKRLYNKSFSVAPIVQQMFNKAGITPQCPDKNVFLTVIDGVHCSFKTILKCNEEHPNKLFIYSPFPVPVPKHLAEVIPHELKRLNENKRYKSEIAIQENNGEYSIFAFTDCEFEKTPTTDEVKELMIHTIDLMDNANFRSLICAIMGYATYDELEKAMKSNAPQVEGNNVEIQMTDGYYALHDKSAGVTSPRYYGRLLVFSAHIIENKISQERAQLLLDHQAPLALIIQEAYNVADDSERDILRKLHYLALYKKTDSDDDSDSVVGRLEAMLMIVKDKYSLLYGTE